MYFLFRNKTAPTMKFIILLFTNLVVLHAAQELSNVKRKDVTSSNLELDPSFDSEPRFRGFNRYASVNFHNQGYRPPNPGFLPANPGFLPPNPGFLPHNPRLQPHNPRLQPHTPGFLISGFRPNPGLPGYHPVPQYPDPYVNQNPYDYDPEEYDYISSRTSIEKDLYISLYSGKITPARLDPAFHQTYHIRPLVTTYSNYLRRKKRTTEYHISPSPVRYFSDISSTNSVSTRKLY